MARLASTLVILMGSVAQISIAVAAENTAVENAAVASADTGAKAGGLEEVMVTAQRRTQRMQDVPITVTAITAKTLEKMGVTSTSELSTAVPGLFMSKTTTVVQPFLRGVGTASLAPGNDPSVPLYIDGVYHSAPAGLFFAFNNIERIEVLKGPQGTLFGRNATGGLIQVITRDPTAETVAKASVGFGKYDAYEASGYVSGGTDTVAADLAVVYHKQTKGWGHNLFTPGSAGVNKVNGVAVTDPAVDSRAGFGHEFGIRSKIVMHAGDNTTGKLSFMYMNADSDMGHYRDGLPGATAFKGYTHTSGFYDYNSDTPWTNKNHQFLITAEIAHEANFATIKSISSYLVARAVYTVPSDGTPYPNTATSNPHLTFDTFTQELQLLSNKNSGPSWLEWISGIYYLTSKAGYSPLATASGNFLEMNTARYSYQKSDSLAGYGQATANLTPSTRFTLGLRYNHDVITANQYVVGLNSNALALNSASAPSYFNVLNTVTNLVPDTQASFNKLTGKVVLDQRLMEDVLAYASVSRGYKAGAWNHGSLCLGAPVVGACNTAISPAVKPEVLDSYEIGVKSDLLDRRLRLNVSAFYYNYKNLQVQAVVGVPPVSILTNAATARTYGLEIETVAQVTDNFSLNFGASFLDAKYKSSPGAIGFARNLVGPAYGNTTFTYDAGGNNLSQAPKFTMNLGGDLKIPTSVGIFDLNASWYHNSGFFWDQQNRLTEGSYDIVNGQISYNPTDSWRIRVWGKNLLAKKYYGYEFASTAGDQGTPAAPRTFGIALDWHL